MNEMILFQDKKVRRIWNESNQKWYFSIVDVVEVLTESNRPRKYWNDLKSKLKNEGSELSEKIGQLKMQSSDGKFYDTDVAASTTEIAKKKDVQGLPENKKAAIEGGTVAGNARKELEEKSGTKVSTRANYNELSEGIIRKKKIQINQGNSIDDTGKE
ncbi:MAG: hypothetical protein L6282_14530 [Candidatus Methanoperedenaceae archaeon]|nr:hypothetical protein [Candidatus Methanoperedenaceae archaeon]